LVIEIWCLVIILIGWRLIFGIWLFCFTDMETGRVYKAAVAERTFARL
jgi:hypothetical protein